MPTKETTPNSNKNFAFTLVVVVAMFATGLLVGLNANQNRTSGLSQLPDSLNYQLIQEVYSKIDANYIQDLPQGLQLSQGVIKGIVEGLDDTYSAYLNPKEAEDYLNSTGSNFEGIGVQLGFKEDYTVVETVFEGSPAEKAGLLAKDIITEVNGESVAGLRPEVVATKIRGQAGTTVKLRIFRESLNDFSEFNIVRAQIDIKNIDFQVLEDGIVKINIRKFTERQSGAQSGIQVFNRQWDEVVNQVKALNPKGLIIDMRGNPGGYVESVKYVAEEFLKDGQIIMRERDRNSGETIFKDNRQGQFEGLPVSVIVNEGSASASEILAAAIQQNNLGKIVGQQTVGKGVEQKLIPISDGSLLILVFRSWLTPNGDQISQENPIKPDFEVEFKPAEANSNYDSQVAKAVELL